MKLFISGKGEFTRASERPSLTKIRKFLDSSKDGELFETSELSNKVKLSGDAVKNQYKALVGYSHKLGFKRYWGKPSTIRQLIKETR